MKKGEYNIVKYIYQTVLEPILTNQIVINWIAPIITGLIVVLIPAIVTRSVKKRNLAKNIQDINNIIEKKQK